MSAIRRKLIDAGVKHLKEYGYPSVSPENIITDPIYSAFFETMLNGTKGHRRDVDMAIDELLGDIAKATESQP